LEEFQSTDSSYISSCYMLNSILPARLILHYYDAIAGADDFYFGCVTSIAGQVVSPLFSVYAASKAATSRLIESINVELVVAGATNRITDFCPGHIVGSSFYGRSTNLVDLNDKAKQLVEATFMKTKLSIPDYETVYKSVIEDYNTDRDAFGISSYAYKLKRGQRNE
jgi:short-subunit dehydrogenase